MTGHVHAWGAMPMRSPLTRERPWLTDGAWIAHESLTVFTHLAGTMPRNGLWRMTEHGPVHAGESTVKVAAFVEGAMGRSEPCVVHHGEYQRADNREAAMESAMALDQVVEVLDLAARPWRFDHGLVEVATLGQSRWTWRLAPGALTPNPVLIGTDHKGRPRFLLASLNPEAGE